ncbi:unnamed protein product [Ectocarpus sp. 6 AP-2014]
MNRRFGIQLQKSERLRSDGSTPRNLQRSTQSRFFEPEEKLPDDPSCQHLRTAGIAPTPMALWRWDGGLAVPPREHCNSDQAREKFSHDRYLW